MPTYKTALYENRDGMISRLTLTADGIVCQFDHPANAADRYNPECAEWIVSLHLDELERMQDEYDCGNLTEIKA